MRQRDFPRLGHRPAAGHGGGGERVVRGAEGPVQQHRVRTVGQPRDRPDLRCLQRLLTGHVRQDGGKPARKHRFARAGRSDQQDIVPARGGDLQRALDVLLPHHIGKVGVWLVRLLRLPSRLRRKRPFPLEVLHERHDVAHAVDGHAVSQRRLGGVRRGDVERLDPRAGGGHRHRQHAVHRAQRAGKGKLADKGRVLRGGLDLLRAGEDAEQDGQVVERALLLFPRRGKVHRDARNGELHAAVLDRRAHALARFLDRRVAKPHNIERRKPSRKEAFHRHLIAGNALKPQ